jgi:hypothetical protein
MRELDDLTEATIDAAIHIHRDLGPGLLESVSEAVLARALEKRGVNVERQAPHRERSPSLRVSAPPREPLGVNPARLQADAGVGFGESLDRAREDNRPQHRLPEGSTEQH